MSSERDETIELRGIAATHALAARLAADLRPGDVLALTGELGSGKTEFTRGLAQALGIADAHDVASPSYLLLAVHRSGRLPLAHFDAYFMHAPDDLERAGLADLVREGCVVVVEWADRVATAIPPHARWLDLEPGDGPDVRTAVLRTRPSHAEPAP